MTKLLEYLKKPGVQILLLIGFLTVISAGVWGFYQTQTSPEQPILFPHNIHVNFQIPCLYCHPGALRQASAGLPTEQKCWACHGQLKKYYQPPVPVEQWPPELQKLANYVKNSQPINWVPVYQVPDFVHFNHRPHIAASLNCETCHGDMSKKTVATVEETVNMGWCLKCHRAKTENNLQNNPNNDPAITTQLSEKRTKLLDCGTCHY